MLFPNSFMFQFQETVMQFWGFCIQRWNPFVFKANEKIECSVSVPGNLPSKNNLTLQDVSSIIKNYSSKLKQVEPKTLQDASSLKSSVKPFNSFWQKCRSTCSSQIRQINQQNAITVND